MFNVGIAAFEHISFWSARSADPPNRGRIRPPEARARPRCRPTAARRRRGPRAGVPRKPRGCGPRGQCARGHRGWARCCVSAACAPLRSPRRGDSQSRACSPGGSGRGAGERPGPAARIHHRPPVPQDGGACAPLGRGRNRGPVGFGPSRRVAACVLTSSPGSLCSLGRGARFQVRVPSA